MRSITIYIIEARVSIPDFSDITRAVSLAYQQVLNPSWCVLSATLNGEFTATSAESAPPTATLHIMHHDHCAGHSSMGPAEATDGTLDQATKPRERGLNHQHPISIQYYQLHHTYLSPKRSMLNEDLLRMRSPPLCPYLTEPRATTNPLHARAPSYLPPSALNAWSFALRTAIGL